MNTRIQWIDEIKGLGILLVMFTHFKLYWYPYTNFITDAYMLWFFFLSGYVSKDEPLAVGMKKKVQRLLIPYFFYGFICLLVEYITSHEFHFIGLLYSRNVLNLADWDPNRIINLPSGAKPLWFLTCLFVAYLWFYIYLKLKSNIHKVGYLLFCVAVSIAMVKLPILLPWSIDTSFMASLFLILGYEFKKNQFFNKKKPTYLYIGLFVIYCLTWWCNYGVNLALRNFGRNFCPANVFFCIVTGVISIILLQLLFNYFKNKTFVRIFSVLGKESLHLMCIHMLSITAVNNLLTALFGTSNFLFTVIGIIVSTYLCIFITRLTRNSKNSMIKWI